MLTYRSTVVSIDPTKLNPSQQRKWYGATSQTSCISLIRVDVDALIDLIFWAIPGPRRLLAPRMPPRGFHQWSFRNVAILHIPIVRYRTPCSKEATGSSSLVPLDSGVCAMNKRAKKRGGQKRRVWCGKRLINRSNQVTLLNRMHGLLLTRKTSALVWREAGGNKALSG